MNAPETWLALLRVVVGAWFLKAVWTKLELKFLWGVVPFPIVSERFLAFHPKRVAEFAAGNPVGWYKDFLETTVMPRSHTFAELQAYGEAAVGLGLVLGLLTGAAASGHVRDRDAPRQRSARNARHHGVRLRVDHRGFVGPPDRRPEEAAIRGERGPPGPRPHGDRREHLQGRGVQHADVPGLAVRHVRAGAVRRKRDVDRAVPAGRRRLREGELRHVDHRHDVRLLARDEEKAGVRREAHPARIPRHGDLL